ncbi:MULTISPECIES: N-acetyltransferase [unclassified Undibacterium]|uniref:GNAT family N-acetyltransferase n=1 Tax=unclassified Undibacterium TaxID=2630295 RepID=UPI002AC975A6|nr:MULTISPECIES: N-acetyltransferase [unclassified Undibacterium]MEB0139606.1 N-acetyltransferase [Undibacterium sp. CCC2.1]MEB0171962.1 N-acetyltransferase [Undibacterium sp. CCC1.1]MEB0213957.1 N-acetyltransferase [Undibacterium sp. 5I2]WPX43573.1 N-acetyltransferase [Undibacterium sp. CCC3.4]
MPLAAGVWNEVTAAGWVAEKDRQWQEHAYGPWAIRIDKVFAGWGGFQKEAGVADLALVLLPKFWGHGGAVLRTLLQRRAELHIDIVTILLPPSRTKTKALQRFGFHPAGSVDYDGQHFLKFQLS